MFSLKAIIACICVAIGHISAQAPQFGRLPGKVNIDWGQTATLSCPIRNLGTRTVLWRRAGESAPLTVGADVIDAEARPRLSVSTNTAGSVTFFNLTIERANTEDTGSYYCQIFDNRRIRTSPRIKLLVGGTPYRPVILGETRVQLGDPILLTCRMPRGTATSIAWYKDGDQILTSANTVLRQSNSGPNRRAGNTLHIRHAQLSDTGTYVCMGIVDNNRVIQTVFVRVTNPSALDNEIPFN